MSAKPTSTLGASLVLLLLSCSSTVFGDNKAGPLTSTGSFGGDRPGRIRGIAAEGTALWVLYEEYVEGVEEDEFPLALELVTYDLESLNETGTVDLAPQGLDGFDYPAGLAVHDGTVWTVFDNGVYPRSSQVHRFDAATGEDQSTTYIYSRAYDLAYDDGGLLVLRDDSVERLDLESGTSTTVFEQDWVQILEGGSNRAIAGIAKRSGQIWTAYGNDWEGERLLVYTDEGQRVLARENPELVSYLTFASENVLVGADDLQVWVYDVP